MTQSNDPIDPQSLLRRIEQLERDNERMRERMDPNLGPDNPNFHPREFIKVLQRTVALISVPPWLVLGAVIAVALLLHMPRWRIGPIPVIDIGGMTSGMYGQGFGIISCGGVAFGGIAMGGAAVGLVAIGGAAVGVVAIGGGAVGLVAIGGGACGYIAVGGNAVGYYAMGQKAGGKYALGLNRQDQEAVDFFVRYVPGLRRAVTNPMPVILLGPNDQGQPGSSPVT
jgi:hypothetical protein